MNYSDQLLEKLIGPEWINLINKEQLIDILERLDELHLYDTIYPTKKNTFKVFQLLDPMDINVVILSMDPYPGEAIRDDKGIKLDDKIPFANGLAFSVSDQLETPKSLKVILEAVETNVYGGFKEDFPMYKGFSTDLHTWTNQGVFLLNSYLTVKQGVAGSHKHIWRDFTSNLLSNLSKLNPNIVYLLWGSDANYFRKDIQSGVILTDIHPAATAYNKSLTFNGRFVECNAALNTLNKSTIFW